MINDKMEAVMPPMKDENNPNGFFCALAVTRWSIFQLESSLTSFLSCISTYRNAEIRVKRRSLVLGHAWLN